MTIHRDLHPRLIQIASEIRDKVFRNMPDNQTNLFLIGAKASNTPGNESLRARLRPVLQAIPGITVWYPEELFGDLIFGEKLDLLGLENLLAKSVHAVVICPESAGSLVELGAFTNHPDLPKRLVVIGNQKHRRAQSFIRLGPIRYLIQKKLGRVLWFDYKSSALSGLAAEVVQAARKIKKSHPPERNLTNLIYLGHFLLTVVCVMQPVKRSTLVELVNKVTTAGPVTNEVVGAAINHLIGTRAIMLESEHYSVTPLGIQLMEQAFSRYSWTSLRKKLDGMRTEVLNLYFRRKFRFGGKAVIS